MEGYFFLICVTLTVGTCYGYSPVYGFDGASSVVNSGRTLHYFIRLNKCTQKSGIGYPEYAHPFGSHVTKWRTFNDREQGGIPYLSFHEQIPVLNSKGALVQLSRDIQIVSNESAIVTSSVYRSDYGELIFTYSHECTMSTPDTPGDIDFKATEKEPVHLNSVDAIVTALQAGEYLHFSAMTFLCAGGVEHTFSGLGGFIPNYELVFDNSSTVDAIKFFVQTTVHYDHEAASIFAAVIDVSISRNHTVTIVDTLASTPSYIPLRSSVINCGLEFGPPGGTFSVLV